MARIAINGLGRIGRAAFKILQETPQLDLVAINDLASTEDLAYLLNYDSVYGRYPRRVVASESSLKTGDQLIPVLHLADPKELPWRELAVDIVLECTGRFTRREDLEQHLQAGARHVILSAPGKGEEIVSIVEGVSTRGCAGSIISCASCTTNCITPVAEIMMRRIGVRKAIMTTIHAYTASQDLVDGPNKQLREGRAAAVNLVPGTTGAAIATTKILPDLQGKFDGLAVRVPVAVGSLADLVFLTERPTTVEEVNRIFIEEADSLRYRDILGVTQEPLVSSDIIQDPRASIVDLGLTQVVDGDLVKILSWYDNEWGYTQQMIRGALEIAAMGHHPAAAAAT
jgi:glyceraldehyde 3-phosphate dehydrogenase